MLLVAVVAYGIVQDSKEAALFLNGVMVNLIDPVVWLLAFPMSLKIRRDMVLLPLLFAAAILLSVIKLYMTQTTGWSWFGGGSITGNVVGFVLVGYLINAVVVFRRRRRESIAQTTA